MKILAMETSCDDTSVAIIDDKRNVLHCEVLNQDSDHRPFGGIVPEIASRSHAENLIPLVHNTLEATGLSWDDIHGVAATHQPGLLGSLIVGVTTAKTLAIFLQKPYIGVHHIEGHIASGFLQDSSYKSPDFFNESFIGMVVSGGHTQIYRVDAMKKFTLMSQSVDDAAGEVIDKFSKTLGLGFPGGARLDKEGQSGQMDKYKFPKPKVKGRSIDMSFSGLKTAGLRVIQSIEEAELLQERPHLAASFQKTISEILIDRLKKVIQQTGIKKIVVAGGVSANSFLRRDLENLGSDEALQIIVPPLRYCTDNAAMIGLAGLWRLQRGEVSDLNLQVESRAQLQ